MNLTFLERIILDTLCAQFLSHHEVIQKKGFVTRQRKHIVIATWPNLINIPSNKPVKSRTVCVYFVKKYFGFVRAAGADHFDPKYRDMSFEKRGIFKWSSNAMYTYGLAIPFGFAIATGSQSMFIVSFYTYISIWLHYFCTEKEDFKIIYGNN